MRLKKIINYLNNNSNIEWVFIDFFDTIVHRRIHINDRNRIWSRMLTKEISFPNYSYIMKIRHESELFLESKKKAYSYSDLFNEVYNRLFFVECFRSNASKVPLNNFINICLKIEIELEKKILFVDEDNLEIVKELKTKGIKTAIVSDFYLTEKELTYFLTKLDILKYFDRIYVSSDRKKAKNTGELYSEVLKDLVVPSVNCLMIGDNKWSDYYKAKELKIHAIYLKNKHFVKQITHKDVEEKLIKFAESNSKMGEKYVNYVFPLFLFITRLNESLEKNQINRVHFFSREGEFLKKLFDEYKNFDDLFKISSNYLYVSRLSTYIPTLNELAFEDFQVIFNQYKDLSLSSFLLSIGFNEKDIDILAESLNCNPNEVIKEFGLSTVFKNLKHEPTFIRIYDKNRREQRANIIRYLSDNNIDNNTTKLAVVDIGWKGTIQDSISKLFEGKTQLYGYYFGVSENSISSLTNIKHGLIFSFLPIKSKGYDIWSIDKTFLERLLHASHPSTSGYLKIDDKIKPIFNVFKSEESSFNLVKDTQEQILKIFKDIYSIINDNGYSPDDFEYIFKKIHLETVFKIKKKHLVFQKTLLNNQYENFGINMSFNEFSKNKFSNKNIIERILTVNLMKLFKELKNTENQLIVARIFTSKNLYFPSLLTYRIIYYQLNNKLKKLFKRSFYA